MAASRGAQGLEAPEESAPAGDPCPIPGGGPDDRALPDDSDGVGPLHGGAVGEGAEPEEPGPASPGSVRSTAREEISLPGGRRTRKPGHYGLRIRFEERPEDPELGWLIESTVWVNAAHPAYLRAVSSRSEGYHLALTAAMALAPLAVEPERVHGFVTSFLARWGDASRR